MVGSIVELRTSVEVGMDVEKVSTVELEASAVVLVASKLTLEGLSTAELDAASGEDISVVEEMAAVVEDAAVALVKAASIDVVSIVGVTVEVDRTVTELEVSCIVIVLSDTMKVVDGLAMTSVEVAIRVGVKDRTEDVNGVEAVDRTEEVDGTTMLVEEIGEAEVEEPAAEVLALALELMLLATFALELLLATVLGADVGVGVVFAG